MLCVCGTNKPFEQCCGRFLDGGHLAKTPVQLMRSRYSAYALGGYGNYLINSWHPAFAVGLNADELSMRSTDWVALDVIDKSQKGDKGTVEFKAYYLDDDNNKQVHHERSNFERISGRWFYLSGDIK